MTLIKTIMLTLAMIGALSMVSGKGYLTKAKKQSMEVTQVVKEVKAARVEID